MRHISSRPHGVCSFYLCFKRFEVRQRMEEATIRSLRADDADRVAALSESLGYPVVVDRVRSRLEELTESHNRVGFAAVCQGVVVGWIDAALEQHLQSESVVTISGLVVAETMRGNHIGRKLCLAVEAWAAQIGVRIVRVRSQQKRADAHRFYLRDGYTQVKISSVFEKPVAGSREADS